MLESGAGMTQILRELSLISVTLNKNTSKTNPDGNHHTLHHLCCDLGVDVAGDQVSAWRGRAGALGSLSLWACRNDALRLVHGHAKIAALFRARARLSRRAGRHAHG